MNKYIKFVLSPIIKRIRREEEKVIHDVNREVQASSRSVINELQNVQYAINRVPYYNGERIRIVFLFQVASFWPSIEPLYNLLSHDSQFETKLLCYDEDYDRTIKTDTARQYLNSRKLDYVSYDEFDIGIFHPHIVVVQTPYDSNRRQRFKSGFLKSKGYRIIYIPYGIEIAATEHAKNDHFNKEVVLNCWRLYTLSDVMKRDYLRYCANASAVCAVGLPKFDALYDRDKISLSDNIRNVSAGKKLILWKVHFPKVIWENDRNILVTPYIEEYIAFAKKIHKYNDIFFIFMPHPRFKEFNEDVMVKRNLETLMEILQNTPNVYIDSDDDYRNSLMNVQGIIVDRSAVMVEAGSVGVPIMYMYNPDFEEPLTDAIKPLIDSYYQGTRCQDMERFLNMCRKNEDPLKTRREMAFQKCVPYFDGQCSQRIKEDIVEHLHSEYSAVI